MGEFPIARIETNYHWFRYGGQERRLLNRLVDRERGLG